jgi:hypothetical protein
MTNRRVLTGILAVALVFGFVAGCDNGNNSGGGNAVTKFEGKWQQQSGDVTHVYTFIGNTMTYTGGTIKRNGTFTFTDTAISFIPAKVNTWTGWTQGYTLEGGTLTLTDDKEAVIQTGRFKNSKSPHVIGENFLRFLPSLLLL